jgi:hypothetical protein
MSGPPPDLYARMHGERSRSARFPPGTGDVPQIEAMAWPPWAGRWLKPTFILRPVKLWKSSAVVEGLDHDTRHQAAPEPEEVRCFR